MNAVVDALSEFGITHIDMPATPHRIWQAIQAARGLADSARNRQGDGSRASALYSSQELRYNQGGFP